MPTASISPEVKLPDGRIWKNITIPEKAKVAETLDEFRAAHNTISSTTTCARFNAEVPIFVQWDDHEVMNNWSASKQISRYAYKVRDINLLAARAGPRVPRDVSDARKHRRTGPDLSRPSTGLILDVFMLDERSYRGPNGPACRHTDDPVGYFLGRIQLAWLKRGL